MSNSNTLSSTLPVQRSQTNDQRNGEKMLKMIERQSSRTVQRADPPPTQENHRTPHISIHASPERAQPVISTATHGVPTRPAYFDKNLDEMPTRGRGRGRGRGSHRDDPGTEDEAGADTAIMSLTTIQPHRIAVSNTVHPISYYSSESPEDLSERSKIAYLNII